MTEFEFKIEDFVSSDDGPVCVFYGTRISETEKVAWSGRNCGDETSMKMKLSTSESAELTALAKICDYERNCAIQEFEKKISVQIPTELSQEVIA